MNEENKTNLNGAEIVESQAENIAVTPTHSNNKYKKIIIAVSVVAVAVVACIVLVVSVIIPAVKYNSASNLMQEGSYNEAIAIFEELADYKDSQSLKEQAAVMAKIAEAEKLYQSGKKTQAYKLLYDDRSNEEAAKILARYKEEILADFEEKIYWEEDDMSYYRFAYSYRGERCLSLIYLSQNKDDPSENHIRFATSFIEMTDVYSFISPIHPHTIRIKGENGMVDIAVSLNDRSFVSLSEEGYNLNGWKEDIDVEISFEKMKEIIDVIKNSEKIDIRVIGSSKHQDYTSDISGLKNIADYIEAVYVINGLA